MTRILFVCTGNICRSPMAAAMSSRLLDSQGGFEISSAGLLDGGRAPTDEMLRVMSERNFDLSDHLSTNLKSALFDSNGRPDLVVAMAREHLREVALLSGDLLDRTFTLKELVRRAKVRGQRRVGESLQKYLTELSKARSHADLLGFSSSDDVADPIGRGLGHYRRCAQELELLTKEMVEYLWPRGAVT